MATYNSNGGTFGRKFGISRENGLTDKNGRPHFFEWIKELPADKAGRKFETRPGKDGSPKHYELFTALDGYLTGIEAVGKAFEGRDAETWLVLTLTDEQGEYTIEAGQVDGRFAMDIMKRLLDPAFDPKEKIRMSPYAFTGEDGRPVIGVGIICGMDSKLQSKASSAHLQGISQPGISEFKGKKLYDWMPVAKWLYTRIQKTVIPSLKPAAPVQTNIRPTAAASQASSDPFPDFDNSQPQADDLPF